MLPLPDSVTASLMKVRFGLCETEKSVGQAIRDLGIHDVTLGN